MITLPDTKIEKAAVQKFDGRPVLNAVYFDAERQVAVAADGYILAVVPCECEFNTDQKNVLVPLDAIKELRKVKANKTFDVSEDGKSVSFCSKAGNVTVETTDGHFPDYTRITADAKKPGTENTVTIGLSAKFLLRLAEAVSNDGDHIALTIQTDNLGSPYTVHSPSHYSDKDAMGLIMPYHIVDKTR